MTTLHHEILVDAPVSHVWSVLADLPAVARYNPTVATAVWDSAERAGVGAARRCTFKDGAQAREQVTVWEPERALGLALVESSWPVTHCRWVTRMEATDGGTRIHQDMEYEVKFGWLGRLLDAIVMRRKFNAILDDLFASMRDHLASTAPGRAN